MTRRFGLTFAIFALTTLIIGNILSAAAAQTEASELQIITVDTANYPDVAIGVSLPPEATNSGIGGFTLSEGGVAQQFSVEALATPVTVALVFDTSGSMAGAPLDAAKSAAKTCLRGLPARSNTALITYDDQVRVLAQPTDNSIEVESLIDGLTAQGETATYSALWNAAVLLGPGDLTVEDQSSRFVVLVSDGEDTVSKTTRQGAVDILQSVDLGVLALAITSGEADFDALRSIVDETDGVFASGGTDDLNRICQGIVERLTNRYVLRYRSAASGPTQIDITYTNAVVSLAATTTPTMPVSLSPAPDNGLSDSSRDANGAPGQAALGSESATDGVAELPPGGDDGEGDPVSGAPTNGEGTTTGTVNDGRSPGSNGGDGDSSTAAGSATNDSDTSGDGTDGSTPDLGAAGDNLAFDSQQGTVDIIDPNQPALPNVNAGLNPTQPNNGNDMGTTTSPAGSGDGEVAASIPAAEPAVAPSLLNRVSTAWRSPMAIWAGAALIGLATALALSMGFSSLVVFGAPPRARANLSRSRVRDQVDGQTRIAGSLSTLSGFFDRLLEGRGERKSSINVLLERAGMAVRPGELLAAIAVVTFLVASLLVVLGYRWYALAALVVIPLIARYWVKRKGKKRRDAFKSQLGDTLMIMSGSLQAGHSLMRSISSVASQAPEPTAEEFSRVVTETRIGRDPIDSLNHLAERIDSEDLTWTVRAMALNRELGGNLSEILDNVGETIRDRGQVADQVRALSSEGKFSAYTLFALPFVVALAVSFLNPGYLVPLFQTTLGNIVIGVALTLLLIGAFWIKKIITLDY